MSDAEAEVVLQRAAVTARVNGDRSSANGPSTVQRSLEELVTTYAAAEPDPAAVARASRDREESERRERVVECWRHAGIPDRYRDARLEQVSDLPADVADGYLAAVNKLRGALTTNRSAIYALCGEIGAGKTHMACGLIAAFCDAGRSARHVKAADYVEGQRATWRSQRPDEESSYVQRFVRYALLVIDEWQVRNDTANENALLLRLIDKRYEANRVTLLVGNQATKDELVNSIDERVADRMHDGGGIILCNWASVRGRVNRSAS